MANLVQPSVSIGLAQKLLYRFILLFIALYVIPNDLSYGFIDSFGKLTFWDRPIIWVGNFFFGWEFDKENLLRSFDYRFELCRYIFVIITALLVSAIWIGIDKYLKSNYEKTLKIVAQTVLRYHIALIMIGYGISKIFSIQFGSMDIDKMELTVGEQSPMGFMWSFMSFSKTVTFFSGWIEFIGAFLLFFRKTVFLGALLLIGVLTGVVIMDIGYDVSVTLYAIQLFLLVLVLLSSQFKRLFSFVVLNKTVAAETYEPLFKDTKYNKVALAIKTILILVFTVLSVNQFSEYYDLSRNNKNSWFQSKHEVQTFVLNRDTLSNRNLDTVLAKKRWKKIIFNGTSYMPESFEVTNEDDSAARFTFDIDSVAQRIQYKPFVPYWNEGEIIGKDTTKVKWEILNYNKLSPKEYLFEGIFAGDTILVKTKAKDREDYNLMKYSGRFLLDLK